MSEEPKPTVGVMVNDHQVLVRAWGHPWRDGMSTTDTRVALTDDPVQLELNRELTIGRPAESAGDFARHLTVHAEHRGDLREGQIPTRALHLRHLPLPDGSSTVMAAIRSSETQLWMLAQNSRVIPHGMWTTVPGSASLTAFGRIETWEEWHPVITVWVTGAPTPADVPTGTIGPSPVRGSLAKRLHDSFFPADLADWSNWSVVIAAYGVFAKENTVDAIQARLDQAVDNARRLWKSADATGAGAKQMPARRSTTRNSQYTRHTRLRKTIAERYARALNSEELAQFPLTRLGVQAEAAGLNGRLALIRQIMAAGILTDRELDLVRPLMSLGGK